MSFPYRLAGLRSLRLQRRPARRHRDGQMRRLLRIEVLENRLAPANIAVGPSVQFDGATGVLSILGGAAGSTAEVEGLGNGPVAVTIDGRLHSSDPAAPAFDPALAGAGAATLSAISLTGGPADFLTLGNLTTGGDLAVHSDGGVTLAGPIGAAGRLAVTADSLDVQGTVEAGSLVLTTTGLLNVEATGRLIAGDGGSIAAAADYFVNVGQVRADGAHGGQVSIRARDDLNAGTVSAAGTAGPGGQVQVSFTESYIDTVAATTTATGVGGAGGAVSVNGGSGGRLFSSGRFVATGTAGGSVDLSGHDVLLVGTAVDASGTAGEGGGVRVGGDSQGNNPAIPNAQTVYVSPATSIRADGATGGGRVVVWSEESTAFGGGVSAHGGGAGGAIEVSSHGPLTYGGSADAGKGGTLLLDPKFITITAGTGPVFPQFDLKNPGSGGKFGATVVTLVTGNIVVTDPTVNTDTGAVYLFNGLTGALISTLSGSTPGFLDGDYVGSGGATALSNGNFVVRSPLWNGGENPAGAVTWGSGTAGVSGVVSAANSLVGSVANEDVGNGGVIPLPDGNYLVRSTVWASNMGAVTWGDGTKGVTGAISSQNSLVGSTGGGSGD